ncbi:hypothetical protein H5410_064168 [Solanum commersonii]|uniref:Uncharacterized protein n=1 Tax=Solanum commersonii TaxID=4109 RepID=A0A9J5W0Y8_SOLCO|nr:hypothetical protein H5410_064168 [Solanum commersonii]
MVVFLIIQALYFLGVNLTDVDLLEFLQQLADTDGLSIVPPSMNRFLNNKVCRMKMDTETKLVDENPRKGGLSTMPFIIAMKDHKAFELICVVAVQSSVSLSFLTKPPFS